MLFTSFSFFVFLPIVFILYYILPHRYRWILLLLSSAAFYLVFGMQFLILFCVLILVNYFTGRLIYSPAGNLRKSVYFGGIAFNILFLVFFKYSLYLNEGILQAARFLHLHYPEALLRVLFPVGLSYLVFTMLSYLTDIKRKTITAEKQAGILATYFLFFPKLLQGPIERAGRVIPQFREKHEFSYHGVTGGLKLMAWGFFKKLVVADTLALLVNPVFSNHQNISGPIIILGVILFAVQLYADFSGYTDIALGSARILGFDLTRNFKRPYFATSIKDFWNRWHISFSTWLRDYLFLPLAYFFSRKMKKESYLGFRTEKWIYLFSALITFTVCGLWHGNGIHFLIWGLLFGVYLSWSNWMASVNRKVRIGFNISKNSRVYKFYMILGTFLLVSFTFIFFRASSISDALSILTGMFRGWSTTSYTESLSYLDQSGLNSETFIVMIISTIILFMADYLSEKKGISSVLAKTPAYVRWSVYYLLILIIIVYGATETRQFIYLNF